MYKVDAYRIAEHSKLVHIRPLRIQREWMTTNVLNCTPLTFANTIGYGIYFDQDISFVWDGDDQVPARGIKGKDLIWEGRGNGTVSIETGLIFRTDEKTSLMTMPIPNEEIYGTTVVSTLVSTSFFTGEISIVLRIHDYMIGKEITIPAGTNIACLLPISITELNNSVINIKDKTEIDFPLIHKDEYFDALRDVQATGKMSKFYKNAVDHLGNIIGKHEAKKLSLKVIDNTK